MLHEHFGGVRYGDAKRPPLPYLSTQTQQAPLRIKLPEIATEKGIPLGGFPRLAEHLLLTLFGAIGVKYLPEICLYRLERETPLVVFYDFAMSFGIKVEDRVASLYLVDAALLNRVIGYLMQMDALRERQIFDSREIYRLLAYQKFTEVDVILQKLKDKD